MAGLRIGIDIGGTFTDLVAIAADGSIATHKTASTPADYSLGIMTGLQALLGQASGGSVAEVLHATTVGSNTILEGRGARTALITTKGFRDVLEIRDLRMPRLYDIGWTKPAALVERRLRLEVLEKMRPDGTVATPLDPDSLAAAIDFLRREAVASVAVCLLHSYANPRHEQAVAAALADALPGVAVTASHALLAEIKEYPRTSTTVVNAYIQPVVRAYLTALQARLDALGVTAPLHLMQSNGGLASVATAIAAPARIVESGPAAGVVGAAVLARRLGIARAITFDMGGTTAKAGVVEDGRILRAEAMEVGAGVMAGARLLVGAGYMLKLPAIDLAEVGAGGGSICRIDAAGAPKVGPQSAGADPGPVCYGRGGTEPTITDCNLVLGYLDPSGLAGGKLPLDTVAARRAVESKLARPLGLSVEAAAHGMLRVVSATMMRAIRAVTVERGRDARDFSIIAFGGNGPLFAAGIAADLGVREVIIPPMPGVFSAFGLLLADTEHHSTRTLRLRVAAAEPMLLQHALDGLLAEGEAQLRADGFPPAAQQFRPGAMARYVGQSSEIQVDLPTTDATTVLAGLPEIFATEHEKTYGFRAPPGEPVELTAVSLVARGIAPGPRLPERMLPRRTGLMRQTRDMWFPVSGWVQGSVAERADLAGVGLSGPVIIQEYDATCLVPPGMRARLDSFGAIVLLPEGA